MTFATMITAATVAESPRLSAALTWYFLRSMTALAVVLGIILLAAALLKRFVPHVQGRKGSEVKVLEITPIDRQNRVALLGLGNRRWLVGLGAKEMSSLGSWEEPLEEGSQIEIPLEMKSDRALEDSAEVESLKL